MKSKRRKAITDKIIFSQTKSYLIHSLETYQPCAISIKDFESCRVKIFWIFFIFSFLSFYSQKLPSIPLILVLFFKHISANIFALGS